MDYWMLVRKTSLAVLFAAGAASWACDKQSAPEDATGGGTDGTADGGGETDGGDGSEDGDDDSDELPDQMILVFEELSAGGIGGFRELAQIPFVGRSIHAGDFDGDAVLDLLVQGHESKLVFALDTADTQVTPAEEWAPPGSRITVADLDGDGLDDFVAASDTIVLTQWSNGDRTFTRDDMAELNEALWYVDEQGYSYAPAVGDLNDDGLSDLVFTGPYNVAGSPALLILLGQGERAFSLVPPQDLDPPDLGASMSYSGPFRAVEDTDGDGHADVLSLNAITSYSGDPPESDLDGFTAIYRGRGDGTFDVGAMYRFGGLKGADPGRFADADGDGDLDGLVMASGALSFARNHGDGTFGALETLTTYAEERPPLTANEGGFALADFTGDGIEDIAWVDPQYACLHLVPGLGDGAYGDPIEGASTDLFLLAQEVADLDGDGRFELLVLASPPYDTGC